MKRVWTVTAVSAHALLLGGAALAQEVEPDRRLGTVVITSAPGPDRPSDELIGNATALDRGDIVSALSSTLGDTLSGQPGVTSTYFGQGASRPVLRGLGAERVQVLTNGIGVIDVSAASPDHQVSADGIDADKIEILRGPAALAYGGQAIGGVVNVIDGLIVEELPERATSGEAFGAYNSVNEGTELGARARIYTGPIVFALAASKRDFGDFEIPGLAESRQLRHQEELEHEAEGADEEDHDHEDAGAGIVPNSFVETESLGAGLSWIGDRAFAGVAVRRQTSVYGLPGAHAHEHEQEEGEEEEDGEQEAPFIDLEQVRYDFRGGVELNGPILNSLTATLSYSDYEHAEFEEPGVAGSQFKTDGYEGRVELDHSIGGMQGAVGFQFLDKSLDASGDEAFLTPTDTRSWALFLYESREWDSGFGVEGGLRLETLEHDNQNAGARDYDLVSASAGVHQHFGAGWFAGAQVAYTERAPNESELFAFGPHLATGQFEVGDATLDAEKGLNLEGTLRWTGDGTSLRANLFVTRFDGFVFLRPGEIDEEGTLISEADGLPVFVFSQTDATLKGGEIYGEHILAQRPFGAEWSVRGGLDYVHAELDGNGRLPFVPPLRLTGQVDAEWNWFEAGARIEWADNQKRAGEGQFGTGSYTLLNLRAALNLHAFGLGGEGTQIFAEVRNATDEDIRLATSALRDTVPLPGRNVRAGLRVTF